MESETFMRYCNIPKDMVEVIPIYKTLDAYVRGYEYQNNKKVSKITLHPGIWIKLQKEVDAKGSFAEISINPTTYKDIPVEVTTAQYSIILE